MEELGNLVARVRMACAYYVANTTTTLVLGTCDRTERMLGTVTKYGDDAADVHPLGGLYRTEVVALGRELGLPDRVVDQPSTLESAIGRREEAAFGASFDVIDAVLERLVDRDIGIERTAEELDADQEVVRRFAGDHVRTKHKRAMPPTTAQRVGPGAFHELELKFE
ncbi:NAD(+) synthase [Halobaculum litoreum]|uniref:NH(3)-dependent NAD(+) synthetase n=1 Tax=Halobaculum litoreum TaxID=3031998 RepID=A0ABD5XW27_9EURY